MQKLPKKPTKTCQKSGKNLVDKNPAKIFVDHFVKILTKNIQKYPKTF